MNSKEIEELREKVYKMSNSMLPLNTFFNDIRDNPNENYDKELAYNDLEIIVDRFEEYRKTNEKLNKRIIELEDKILKKGKELYILGNEKDELEERNEKLEKVIDILKNKVVNLTLLNTGDYRNYVNLCCWNNCPNDFIITKEEYELLKEVLQNVKN